MVSLPLQNSKINYKFIVLIAIATPLLFMSCDVVDDNDDFEPIDISGFIVDSSDQPVENAIVRLVEPPPEINTVTDSDGFFGFEMDVDSTINVKLIVSKEGFVSDTLNSQAIPERNIEFPNTRLLTEEEVEDEIEVEPGEEPSGGPASIELVDLSQESIVVKGSGDTEQAQFNFAVTDSSGNRVTPEHEAEVNFSLGAAPDGGESISPETEMVDDQGEVSAVLTSGTVSGNVQVIAEIQRDEFTVRSEPIKVAIHGGLPNSDHFTIQREPYNVTYVVPDENPSDISVVLGDQYSNPVQPGTSVYFSSTGGVIEGSANTDDQGRAGVQLAPTNPVPEDGIATVTAQTATHNNQTLEREIDVIFSGPPQIEVEPDEFFIENMSDETFEYTVSDANGHPMVNGTQISVEVEGEDIEVIGDVDVTIEAEDVESRQGLTDFSFNVAGTNEEPLERPVFITIEVDGPNGNKTKRIEGRKERVAPE